MTEIPLEFFWDASRDKHLPEAESEVFLISAAVSEPRTRRLGFANTATLVTAVNLGFMEAEHLHGL